MVVRVCERAAASGAISVAVATDDERIQEAVKAHGHHAVMTGAGHFSGTDRIAEAAAALGLRESDIVVNVQGDEPLIEPTLIASVAAALERDTGARMSTACHRLHDEAAIANPNVVKVVLAADGHALYFSRSRIPYPREAGGAWYRHAGIYAYRVGFLQRFARLDPAPLERAESLEQLRALWHGYRIAVAVCAEEIAPGVDTPADLDEVRAQYRRRQA